MPSHGNINKLYFNEESVTMHGCMQVYALGHELEESLHERHFGTRLAQTQGPLVPMDTRTTEGAIYQVGMRSSRGDRVAGRTCSKHGVQFGGLSCLAGALALSRLSLAWLVNY